jgi:fibronectin type 3 domain-containing protein
MKTFIRIAFLFFVSAGVARAQSVALAWVASSASSPTYNVYRSPRISGKADSFAQVATGVSSTTYTDSTVSYGQAYAYYVTCVSGGTESPSTNVILVYVIASNSGRDHFGPRPNQNRR